MGNSCCIQPYEVPMDDDNMPIYSLQMREGPQQSKGSTLPAEPELDPRIIKILEWKKPFEKELAEQKSSFQFRLYSNGQQYFGNMDESNKPNGLGKHFRTDGSIAIGYFDRGVLNGDAFYAHPEGLFVMGKTQKGLLNCEKGLLENLKFKYEGGFKDNRFHGKGVQITEGSKFEGEFENGKKKRGQLSWLEDLYTYQYEGSLDDNELFTGRGKLIQPFGEYEGYFDSGLKHGHARYTYNSKLVFEGRYVKGNREGPGKIINCDGSLSYQGEFKDGLPHGHGRGFKDGKLVHEGKFILGIFQEAL